MARCDRVGNELNSIMPKQQIGLPAISISELKAVVNLILDHIVHDLKIERLQLDEDFYWDITDKKGLYDVAKESPNLDIGSLADDWDFLVKMDKDREQAVSLMLIHVAPLLRYVGEKVGR